MPTRGGRMPSGSDLQGSVDRTREAFRRASVDDAEERRLRPAVARDEAPLPETRGDDVGTLHPFLQGLLDALPAPGTDWPAAKREQWLETARSIFALMYEDAGEASPEARRAEPVDFKAYAETRFGQASA